jgi:hypothetical protein
MRRWREKKQGVDASRDASRDGSPAPPPRAGRGREPGGRAPAPRQEGEPSTKGERCAVHWLEEPCRGCAADRKVDGQTNPSGTNTWADRDPGASNPLVNQRQTLEVPELEGSDPPRTVCQENDG